MNVIKYFWEKSFRDWRYRAILHIGFWLFLLFFWTQESMVLSIKWHQHISVTLVGIAFALFLFYPLVYGFVPLIQKKKWIVAGVFFIVYYIAAILFRMYNIELVVNWYNLQRTWFVGKDFWPRLHENYSNPIKLAATLLSSLQSLIEIIFIPLIIKVIRYLYQASLKQSWLARENAQLQLSTLKAQINPHFFFNTLNNLQSFIVQNEREKSVDLLNQLADFMRASLYDCNGETIQMDQEIALLTNYIAIEKVRFEANANIIVNLSDSDPYYGIPPFIFLPFIENVFKHGGALPAGEIDMHILLNNHPDYIILETKNSYNPDELENIAGIGIQNIRKRLDFYFKDRYSLKVEKSKQVYHVKLILDKP